MNRCIFSCLHALPLSDFLFFLSFPSCFFSVRSFSFSLSLSLSSSFFLPPCASENDVAGFLPVTRSGVHYRRGKQRRKRSRKKGSRRRKLREKERKVGEEKRRISSESGKKSETVFRKGTAVFHTRPHLKSKHGRQRQAYMIDEKANEVMLFVLGKRKPEMNESWRWRVMKRLK